MFRFEGAEGDYVLCEMIRESLLVKLAWFNSTDLKRNDGGVVGISWGQTNTNYGLVPYSDIVRSLQIRLFFFQGKV